MNNTKRGPLFLILFAALMAGAGNGIYFLVILAGVPLIAWVFPLLGH